MRRIPRTNSYGMRLIRGGIVAGALLLTTGAPDTAPLVAAAGVGPSLASEGTGPLGLGALVGALVAGGAALCERFRER